jgi:hypothetical protein
MNEVLLPLASLPLELIALAVCFLLVVSIAARRIATRRKHARNLRNRDKARAEAERKVEQAPRLDEGAEPPLFVYPMPVIDVLEERMFDALEAIAEHSVMGHRVLTQVPLKAFLYATQTGEARAQDKAATARLAALQVDFLIVDADWRPVVAVDLERDAWSSADDTPLQVEACAKAGIAYLTVAAGGLTDAQRAEIIGCLSSVQGIAAE